MVTGVDKKLDEMLQVFKGLLSAQTSQSSKEPVPASSKQQQPKTSDKADDILEDNTDEQAADRDVKRWRAAIKQLSAMDDCACTTDMFGMPKAQKLLEFNRNLDSAQEALRGSKPLTRQQMQVEAHLRKLHKALEGDNAKLATAEEAVQAAAAARDVQLAAVAETQTKIEHAKKQAADIASKLATELGAAPPCPAQAFQPASPEWAALEGLVRLVGNADVHAALRTQGYPEDHLQMLSGCLSTVQAAGDEQLKRSAAALRTPTQDVGHRPPGTADVAADMVAEGNAMQFAALQAKCANYEAQLLQARTDIQALHDDMGSDAESTATAVDTEGFQLSTKRRRKRLGDAIDNLRVT